MVYGPNGQHRARTCAGAGPSRAWAEDPDLAAPWRRRGGGHPAGRDHGPGQALRRLHPGDQPPRPTDDAVLGEQGAARDLPPPVRDRRHRRTRRSIMCAYSEVGGVGTPARTAICSTASSTRHWATPGSWGPTTRPPTRLPRPLTAGLDQEKPEQHVLRPGPGGGCRDGTDQPGGGGPGGAAGAHPDARFTSSPMSRAARCTPTPRPRPTWRWPQQVAEEGTTLLKDRGGILPLGRRRAGVDRGDRARSELDSGVRRWRRARRVLATHPVTPLEGIRAAAPAARSPTPPGSPPGRAAAHPGRRHQRPYAPSPATP